MPKIPDQSLRHRKIRDRALILPLVGLILLTPPLANIFQIDYKPAGLPLILVYVFAVWAALVVGTILLSRALRDAEQGTSPEEAGHDAPGPRSS